MLEKKGCCDLRDYSIYQIEKEIKTSFVIRIAKERGRESARKRGRKVPKFVYE